LEKQLHIEQSGKWISHGLCGYCGGELGGLFSKKCKSCGKAKSNSIFDSLYCL